MKLLKHTEYITKECAERFQIICPDAKSNISHQCLCGFSISKYNVFFTDFGVDTLIHSIVINRDSKKRRELYISNCAKEYAILKIADWALEQVSNTDLYGFNQHPRSWNF